MKYEVIHYFTDLQDFGHPYRVGDTFPRNGMKVSEERLRELSGSNNKQNKPLIKAVENKTQEFSDDDIMFETRPEKQYTKTDINKMNKAELLEMAKRTGVDGADDMTGAELKEYLLNMFGL